MIEDKVWETNFFGRKFGALSLDYNQCDVERDIDTAINDSVYDIIELHLSILGMDLVPILEDKGFRLVETQMSFITLLNKQDIKERPLEIGEVRLAEMADLEKIVDLTHRIFSNNPSFLARFKNRMYFTQEETEKYYAAWIENHLGASDAYVVVVEHESKIIGYLIYSNAGTFNNKPNYRGVLVAVDPDYWGHKIHLAMQPVMYRLLPGEQVYLGIVTQLTNTAAIKNYIRSGKGFESIELIFYWSKKLLEK